MPHIGLQPVECQDDAARPCQSLAQPHRIAQAPCDQLLVAMQQHRHAALGDLYPALPQRLVDLGHAALLTGAQLADGGDDVQAELAVRQRPGARFFGHVRAVIRGDTVSRPRSHSGAPARSDARAHRGARPCGGDGSPSTTAPHTRYTARAAASAPVPASQRAGSRDVPSPTPPLLHTSCLSPTYSTLSRGLCCPSFFERWLLLGRLDQFKQTMPSIAEGDALSLERGRCERATDEDATCGLYLLNRHCDVRHAKADVVDAATLS
jgi:hypothetical protein